MGWADDTASPVTVRPDYLLNQVVLFPQILNMCFPLARCPEPRHKTYIHLFLDIFLAAACPLWTTSITPGLRSPPALRSDLPHKLWREWLCCQVCYFGVSVRVVGNIFLNFLFLVAEAGRDIEKAVPNTKYSTGNDFPKNHWAAKSLQNCTFQKSGWVTLTYLRFIQAIRFFFSLLESRQML